MRIGYARVWTPEQDLDPQLDTLDRAGCEKVFRDKAGGARAERPGLDQALAHPRKGDTLVIWKPDRLDRSLRHLGEAVGLVGNETAIPALEPLTKDRDAGVVKAATQAIDRIRTDQR